MDFGHCDLITEYLMKVSYLFNHSQIAFFEGYEISQTLFSA